MVFRRAWAWGVRLVKSSETLKPVCLLPVQAMTTPVQFNGLPSFGY